MNAKRILLAAGLAGGFFFSAAVSRASVVVSDLATATAAFTAPVPMKVVSPANIPRRYQNETIRLSLTIDETGRPRDIALLAGRDRKLVEHLLPAVARWQFKPATRDGHPVSIRVVLPIEVVEA